MAGTALVGVVVADVYRRLTDDSPDHALTAVADAPTDCPGGSYVVPAAPDGDPPPVPSGSPEEGVPQPVVRKPIVPINASK